MSRELIIQTNNKEEPANEISSIKTFTEKKKNPALQTDLLQQNSKVLS